MLDDPGVDGKGSVQSESRSVFAKPTTPFPSPER